MGLNPETRQWLENRFGDNVRFDEPMARHTSMRIGGPAQAFVTPERVEDVTALIERAREHRIEYQILGGGTNILVTDAGISGITICMKQLLNRVTCVEQGKGRILISAGAGMSLQKLCWHSIHQGWGGLLFALGIPGTVGGAVMMNAGTRSGAMQQVLRWVDFLMPDGRFKRMDRNELAFRYRELVPGIEFQGDDHPPVIVEVGMALYPSDPTVLRQEARKLLRKRRDTQPAGVPSAGCFFKNPAGGRSAGELIERAGLKGIKIGGAEVSAVHANFIINRGDASCSDILALIRLVQDRVMSMWGIALEREVKLVGSQAYPQKPL